MRHFASPDFWSLYRDLPEDVRELADKNFELLKTDPRHPSLRFKKIGKYPSVRVGLRYRALAIETPKGLVWFWIGNHSDYDRLLGQVIVTPRSKPGRRHLRVVQAIIQRSYRKARPGDPVMKKHPRRFRYQRAPCCKPPRC